MKREIRESVLRLIQASLWDMEPPAVTQELFTELKLHTVSHLPGEIFSSLSVDPELLLVWKREILQQIYDYYAYENMQSVLGVSVPYVILKGTTAAQYYPHPYLRTMGDIDIMTRHEDIKKACLDLEREGFVKSKEENREIVYEKDGLVVEIHRRFASLNDPAHAKFLDDLIINNINDSHVLPDLVNGIVLLEHISQHLENGLGLRQIVDWMMFVDKCLPDDKWPEFSVLVNKIGLEKLTLVITRMCEMYLGLPSRKWCAGADEILCNQMLDYILSSGNFGNKMTTKETVSENVFARASTPKSAFRLLQQQGMTNWKAARKIKLLRHFAWIYQAFRYFIKGISRDNAVMRLKKEYKAAKQRNELFESLGVKMKAKGIAVYKNDQYVKE